MTHPNDRWKQIYGVTARTVRAVTHFRHFFAFFTHIPQYSASKTQYNNQIESGILNMKGFFTQPTQTTARSKYMVSQRVPYALWCIFCHFFPIFWGNTHTLLQTIDGNDLVGPGL